MYLVARQGSLYRSRAHRRIPRAVIDDSFDAALPTMTVLVPSYREEIATVRKTLLSAALQEYPYLRIVLLLDDPPQPQAAQHLALLEQARELAAELTRWLEQPRQRFTRLLDRFERVSLVDGDPTQEQMAELADEYGWAHDWLTGRAATEPDDDHVDASSPITCCARWQLTSVRCSGP
jgi:cellulose synthase (UDP-forming)